MTKKKKSAARKKINSRHIVASHMALDAVTTLRNRKVNLEFQPTNHIYKSNIHIDRNISLVLVVVVHYFIHPMN